MTIEEMALVDRIERLAKEVGQIRLEQERQVIPKELNSILKSLKGLVEETKGFEGIVWVANSPENNLTWEKLRNLVRFCE